MKKNKKYTLTELQTLYGDFKPEALLDFHDYDILNESYILEIYDQFIKESIEASQTKVLIITGKGEVIKPLINKTLARDNRVDTYNHAGMYQGGKGAFEIFLKDQT